MRLLLALGVPNNLNFSGGGPAVTESRLRLVQALDASERERERDHCFVFHYQNSITGCTSDGVMYLVFTCMPDESYRRRLRSLMLYLCYVFRTLINALVFCFITNRSLVLFY